MNISGNEYNIESPKGNDDPVNYIPPNMPSNWIANRNNTTNTSIGTITTVNPTVDSSACSSSPMIDSFCFPNWNHPINGHNLGYCDINLQNNVPENFVQNLPHFQDSSFIERAARFSCFSGGNFGEMMNVFSNNGPNEALGGNGSKPKEGSLRAHETEGGPFKDEKRSETFVNSHDVSENQEGSKKRKRIKHNENIGTDVNKRKGDQSPSSSSKPDGPNGEKGCGAPGPPKEDYIHIRARRGQATNSHSLAERVRREKISERMKFLQDLVPGCNKVTGKAVMLDEIINYVQSLQRQVEFLSMKLSTVNPRTDFNIETLISKDILQPQIGLSSSLPFPPDMTMPFSPLTLQSTLVSGGFKEPTYQVPNVWEDELHNIVHMGFNTSSPHTKPEP